MTHFLRKAIALIMLGSAAAAFAQDVKYGPIVNAALADLKTKTKLSLLSGHVAVNISSGNRELDARFAAALKEAYPNFTAKSGTVRNEDLYQMAVKIYRDGSSVLTEVTVTNFKNEKIAERAITVKKSTPEVIESLQYKTAFAAKNEFERYLNTAFESVGGVIEGKTSGMVHIPGGTFTMGSPASERERETDEVQHQVTLNSFYMSRYEVTQKEWQYVMGNDPSYFNGDNLPVEQVSWYDAVEYCNKRSELEGLTPAYAINGENVTWNKNANGYRLPTEAEWEYACRAGNTTSFNTGSNITTEQANYDGNYPYNDNAKGQYRKKTTPVGTFAPNKWGLYDMHGNVWEWCWDWYGNYPDGAQTNPVGSVSGSARVSRGGSWLYFGRFLRSAFRYGLTPSVRYFTLGFRPVRPE